MKKYLPLLLLLLLTACATTPTPINEAKQIPAERLLAFQIPTSDKAATITVIRDEGFLGGGCFAGLYIDQVLAARLDVAEVAKFYVEPGEVLIRVGWDPQGRGLCAFGQDNWTQRETTLKPGEQKPFRIFLDQNTRWDIFRADKNQEK
jgi:predicted component of type VI protein secretion system